MSTAAPQPESGIWVEEIWFEPDIRGCLKPGSASVLRSVVRNQRADQVEDVVLEIEALEFRDNDGGRHHRHARITVGSIDPGATIECEHSLEPSEGAPDIYEVTLLGMLRGIDRASRTELSEQVAFWGDADDRIWLQPADAGTVAAHPRWSALRGETSRAG